MWDSNCLFLDPMDENRREKGKRISLIENKDKTIKKIDKIYSRPRISLPKFEGFLINEKTNDFQKKVDVKNSVNQKKIKKIIRILIVLFIAFLIVNITLQAIEPIIDMQCITMAKGIATKISNEQASIVMANYKYDDLMKITKDEEGNIKLISSNMIVINQIISDIPILIQDELGKVENNKFYIKLGSFTGSKLLAGRGPDVEIKMSVIGNIETDLKSEFSEAGINQTLHRIFLEVKCHVTILTPFHSIDEEIVNQVLLAEGVIVGNIPSTYYNLEGLTKDNFVDVIE